MDHNYPGVSGSQAEGGLVPQSTKTPLMSIVMEEQARLIGKIEALTDALKSRLQPLSRGENPAGTPTESENKEVQVPPIIQVFSDHNARLSRQVREMKSLLDRVEL